MHFGDQVDAAAVRQAQIHQRQRDRLVGQAGPRLGQRPGVDQGVGLIPKLQQQSFQPAADQGFVFHQQHRRRQGEFGGLQGVGHKGEGWKGGIARF
ncbi:hypothetical protein D3C71_1599330 [compost metagenome]